MQDSNSNFEEGEEATSFVIDDSCDWILQDSDKNVATTSTPKSTCEAPFINGNASELKITVHNQFILTPSGQLIQTSNSNDLDAQVADYSNIQAWIIQNKPTGSINNTITANQNLLAKNSFTNVQEKALASNVKHLQKKSSMSSVMDNTYSESQCKLVIPDAMLPELTQKKGPFILDIPNIGPIVIYNEDVPESDHITIVESEDEISNQNGLESTVQEAVLCECVGSVNTANQKKITNNLKTDATTIEFTPSPTKKDKIGRSGSPNHNFTPNYAMPQSMILKGNEFKPNSSHQTDHYHINLERSKYLERKLILADKKFCWKKNKVLKRDIEGFTMYDRHGFTYTEAKAAKACFKKISTYVKNQWRLYDQLRCRFQNFTVKRETLAYHKNSETHANPLLNAGSSDYVSKIKTTSAEAGVSQMNNSNKNVLKNCRVKLDNGFDNQFADPSIKKSTKVDTKLSIDSRASKTNNFSPCNRFDNQRVDTTIKEYAKLDLTNSSDSDCIIEEGSCVSSDIDFDHHSFDKSIMEFVSVSKVATCRFDRIQHKRAKSGVNRNSRKLDKYNVDRNLPKLARHNIEKRRHKQIHKIKKSDVSRRVHVSQSTAKRTRRVPNKLKDSVTFIDKKRKLRFDNNTDTKLKHLVKRNGVLHKSDSISHRKTDTERELVPHKNPINEPEFISHKKTRKQPEILTHKKTSKEPGLTKHSQISNDKLCHLKSCYVELTRLEDFRKQTIKTCLQKSIDMLNSKLIKTMEQLKSNSLSKPTVIMKKEHLGNFDFITESVKYNLFLPIEKGTEFTNYLLKNLNIVNAIKQGYLKIVDSEIMYKYLLHDPSPR